MLREVRKSGCGPIRALELPLEFRLTAALSRSGLLTVRIDTDPEFSFQPPVSLFEQSDYDHFTRTSYDVAPDGRFLMIEVGEEQPVGDQTQINVVLNWFEELNRLIPVE